VDKSALNIFLRNKSNAFLDFVYSEAPKDQIKQNINRLQIILNLCF
jgi:hypothetical protein